ncbi:MAG TPA: hypothetical protein VE944_28960 [Nostoc sp.]|nr:hypothetical protein [Nostoc sp.]HYX18325.1 hypothetical protein [Nostoc sp.]
MLINSNYIAVKIVDAKKAEYFKMQARPTRQEPEFFNKMMVAIPFKLCD